jgi:hypothetical protein
MWDADVWSGNFSEQDVRALAGDAAFVIYH